MSLESSLERKQLKTSHSLACLRRAIKELRDNLKQFVQQRPPMDNPNLVILCAKQLAIITQYFSEKSSKNNLNTVLLLQEKITSCLCWIPVCRPSWAQVIPNFLCLCKIVSQLFVEQGFQNTTDKDIKTLSDDCSVLGELIIKLLQSKNDINYTDAYFTITNLYKLDFFLNIHITLLTQTFEFLQGQCYRKFQEQQDAEISFLIDFILHVVCDERISIYVDDKIVIATKLLKLYVQYPKIITLYPKLLVKSLEHFSTVSQKSVHRNISQSDCLLLVELYNLSSLKQVQNVSLKTLDSLQNKQVLLTSLDTFRNKKKKFKEFLHDKDLDWLLIFSYIPLSYSCIVDKDIILHILKLVYDCTLVLPNEEALRMINKCLIILIHFYRALAYLTIQAYDTLTTQMLICLTKLLATHHKTVPSVMTTSTTICDHGKTLKSIFSNALKLANLTVQLNTKNLSAFLSKDAFGRGFFQISCSFITSFQSTTDASEEFLTFCKICLKPCFRCQLSPDLIHSLLDCFIQLAEFFSRTNEPHSFLTDVFVLGESICQELHPEHQSKLCNVALYCLDKNYLHSRLVMQVTEFLYHLVKCYGDVALNHYNVATETFYASLITLSVKAAMYQSRSNPIRTNVQKILDVIPQSLQILDQWITCIDTLEPLTDDWNMAITGCALCLTNGRLKLVVIERLSLRTLIKNVISISRNNDTQNSIQQDTSKKKSSFFVLLDSIARILTCLALSSIQNVRLVLCLFPIVFENCVKSDTLFSHILLEQIKKVALEVLTSDFNISINENLVQKALSSVQHFIMALILSEGHRIHGVLRTCWFVYIEKFIFNSEISNYLEKCLLLIFKELFAKTPTGYKCCPKLLTSTLKIIKPFNLNFLKHKNRVIMKMESLKVDSKSLNAIDVYNELNSFTYVVLLGIQQLHLTSDSGSSLSKKHVLPYIAESFLNQLLSLQKGNEISFPVLQLGISIVTLLQHEENESFTKETTPKYKESIISTSVIAFSKISLAYSNYIFSNGYTLVFLIYLFIFIKEVSIQRTNQLLQQLLYEVYNFTVIVKSVDNSKSCLEESLIQGLCFLALQLPTRHPRSIIPFKQLFTILLTYDFERLNEITVFYAFLKKQLQDIQNAPTVTMANHVLVLYLQTILAERPEYFMKKKNVSTLFYEIFKMYLNKLSSCSTSDGRIVSNLSITMRQLAEICDPASVFKDCNRTRTQLSTQPLGSQNSLLQFNYNNVLVSTKIHVPATHIWQTIGAPIQDSVISCHINTLPLQTEVTWQTLVSGIQLLECPQQFNQMTLMLQRFDRVPDTEARMRLDKKIITPLCVSQSAQNYFSSTFPPSVQHIPFFFDYAWKEPEVVSRSSSSPCIISPIWSRIIIKATVEQCRLQEKSLCGNAFSLECMKKLRVKQSFRIHGSQMLDNTKRNGDTTFLGSPEQCSFFQSADHTQEIFPRVYSQDDSISLNRFLQKSFDISFALIKKSTEHKSEYGQEVCHLNRNFLQKKHTLSKNVHYAAVRKPFKNFTYNLWTVCQYKHGMNKHNEFSQRVRRIFRNSFKFVSQARVIEVPSFTNLLIPYTPIKVNAPLLNILFRNRPKQHHTSSSTFACPGISNQTVNLISTTTLFKLMYHTKIFALHDNFHGDIDSCRLSQLLGRLKTLNGSHLSYHRLFPRNIKKPLDDHASKPGQFFCKFQVVKNKITFNAVALFSLKTNVTVNKYHSENSSQIVLCSRIPHPNSQQRNDKLHHRCINQLDSSIAHKQPCGASNKSIDDIYNFSFVPCYSSSKKNICLEGMGRRTVRLGRCQLSGWKDIEVVKRSKPLSLRINKIACTTVKTAKCLTHSGFVNQGSFIKKNSHLESNSTDDLLTPYDNNLKQTYDPVDLKFSRCKLSHSMTSLQKEDLYHNSAYFKNSFDNNALPFNKSKVKFVPLEKSQPCLGSMVTASEKCGGIQITRELNNTNFKEFDARRVTSPDTFHQEEKHRIFKKILQSESCWRSDLLTRHKFHIRPNYLELKSRLSDLFCKIERNNETYHLENVNQRSRSQCDNGLTKLKNSVTSFNDFSNKQDFSSLSLRKVTLRQILKIWEKTRRGKSLQHDVVEMFFETTFLLIKNVFFDYKDLKVSETYLNEERICGCRCLCLLHHDPIWFSKCSQKKEVLLLLEIWDHCLSNYPFCLIYIVHAFLDALTFGVEWKEWLLPSFFLSAEKRTPWGIQETFLKSFIYIFHSLNSIKEPFHLLILHVYIGVKLSDFLNDRKYNEKAMDILDEMALIDILLCLVTMWKNKQIPKPEVLIHVVKGLRGFLSPRCLRFLNQTILLRKLMPLLSRCQPPLNSLTNKSWDDISYSSSVDWSTLKDIFFILKHVDSCYEFNNATLDLLFCIILNLLRRSVLMFSDPIIQETATTDSDDAQDSSCLVSLLNYFKYSLSLKESVRICQINGCLLLAQFFLRHNLSSTAFLKNQGIDIVLTLLKHIVKLLSTTSLNGFVDISIMQFGKSLMTLLCNSTFQNVDIQRQLGSKGVYILLCLFSIKYWQQRSGLNQQVIIIGDEAVFVCLKAIGNISLLPENTQYCIKSCVDALYKLLFEFMVSRENRMTLENACKFCTGLLDSFLNIVMEFTEESMIRFRFTIPHLLLLFCEAQKDERILIVDILACLTRCSKNAETFHNSQGHHYIPLQLVHLDQSKVILYDHLVLRLIEKQATRYPCSFIKLCDTGIFEAMKTLIQCQKTPPSIITRIIRISVAGLTSTEQKVTVARTLDKCGFGVALLQYLSSKLTENAKNNDTQRVATWICGLVVLMYCTIEESITQIQNSPILKNTQLSDTLQRLDPEFINVLIKQIMQLYLDSQSRTWAKALTGKVEQASNISDQPLHTLKPTVTKKVGFSESNLVLTFLSLLIMFFRFQKTSVYVHYCYSLNLLPLVIEILQFISEEFFDFTMSCYLADQIYIILLWFYQYLEEPYFLQLCFDENLREALKRLKIYFEKFAETTCSTIQKLVLKTFYHSSRPELNEFQFRGKTMCSIIESIQDLLHSHKKPISQCDILHNFFKSVNYPFIMKNVFSFHSQGVQELENQFKKKLRLGIFVKTIVFVDRPENDKTAEAKIFKPPFPITGILSPTGQYRFFPLIWKTSTNLLNLQGLCRSTGELIFSHNVTHVTCVEQGLDATCFAACRASRSHLFSKVPASHCCSLQLQISQNDTTVVEVPLIFESANSCQNFIQFFLKWRNAVVLGLN